MKQMLRIIGFLFLLLSVVTAACWAMDFDKMSNEELFELRGAIQNAPEPDKTAYQVEWEKRITCLTEEEKKQFAEPPEAETKNDDELDPPRIPAQGYEKEGVQGHIIFGGFPQESGPAR
jgi:hypothetical protein